MHTIAYVDFTFELGADVIYDLNIYSAVNVQVVNVSCVQKIINIVSLTNSLIEKISIH